MNRDIIISNLETAAAKLFNKSNISFCLTSSEKDRDECVNCCKEFVSSLSDKRFPVQDLQFNKPEKNEGFSGSTGVHYIAKGYNFKKLGYEYSGRMLVLDQILSSEYLHHQIRVIGGAYGAFCRVTRSGFLAFLTYSDPQLAETIRAFDNADQFLSSFSASKSDMRRFIIGSIARLDLPLTPSIQGDTAFRRYLQNITIDDLQKEREEVLSTTVRDIQLMKDLVHNVMATNCFCVYGNEKNLESNKNIFSSLKRE